MITRVDRYIRPQQQLPNDFRLYLSENEIIRSVLEAQTLVQSNSKQMTAPQYILSFLCYAYVTDRFSTENLVRDFSTDTALRYICFNNCPTVKALRAFRRHFRELLSKNIAQTIFLCYEKMHNKYPDSGKYHHCMPNLDTFSVTNSEFYIVEAENRITLAAHLDCMAMDE